MQGAEAGRQAGWLAGAALADLAAHAFAHGFSDGGPPILLPAGGVLLAGLVRARGWVGAGAVLLATEFAARLVFRPAAWSALPLAAGEVAVAMLCAAAFVPMARADRLLRSRRSVLALVGVALFGALMSAGIAAAVLRDTHAFARFGAALAGTLLAAPVLLDWEGILRRRDRTAPAGIAESGALLLAVAGFSLAVVRELDRASAANLVLVLVPVPLAVWSSVRLTRAESAFLLLAWAAIATVAAGAAAGQLAPAPAAVAGDPAWLHALFVIAAVTTLLLGATAAEWRAAEQAEHATATLLRAVVDTSPDAVITIDRRGLIESFSPAAERLFGYRAAEVVGRNVKLLMPPHFREHHDGYIARYLATGEKRIIGVGRVVAGQRRDGTTFPMELSVGETAIGARRIFTGFVRDLSEIQRAEKRIQEIQAELFHVGRLGEMGQLASTIAHEVNQPLAAIANYAEAARHLAAAGGADAAVLPGLLDKIEAQSRRAAEIIRRLRSFIEKQEIQRRAEDLSKTIEEALALALVGSRDPGLRVRLEIAAGLPPAWIDRLHIQQVLVNLVRNARDAMAEAPRRVLTIEAVTSGVGMIRVSVADTGPGVAPGIADRLFQSFVTSKPDGMGIGLALCKSIALAHGGDLWHEPDPGGGAIFRFTVPVARDPAAASRAGPAGAVPPDA